MIKLKYILSEGIYHSNDNASHFHPLNSTKDIVFNIYGENQKFKIKKEIQETIKNYKGYRIGMLEGHILNKILLFHPNKDFLIAYLAVFNSDDITSYETVVTSVTHSRFRGKGIGQILYSYALDKYEILQSDTELHHGSLKIWIDKLPKLYPNGQLCALMLNSGEYLNIKTIDKSFNSSNNEFLQYLTLYDLPTEDMIRNFIFYKNKSDIPKNAKPFIL